MSQPSGLSTGPLRRDGGQRAAQQRQAVRDPRYHTQRDIPDVRKQRTYSSSPSANASDDGSSGSEDERPGNNVATPPGLRNESRSALPTRLAPDSVPRPPREHGRRGDDGQYTGSQRRSHSPARLHNPRQAEDEYTRSRRRPSPPAPRLTAAPDAEDTRSSPSSLSSDNGPANAPSPRSTMAVQALLLLGPPRPPPGQQAGAPPHVPSIAGPTTNTRPSRQGAGGRGVSYAAPTVSGSSRSANATPAPGPSSRPARARPAQPMPPMMPYPYPYAYGMPPPGPAMAYYAGPPPPGYAPGGHAVMPLPPPPPPGMQLMMPPPPPPPPGMQVAYRPGPGHRAAPLPAAPALPPPPISFRDPMTGRIKKVYECVHPGCENRPPFETQKKWEEHYSAHFPRGNAFPCTYPGCESSYATLNGREKHIINKQHFHA
ncbi:hypothetical protein AURDEDRAFT_167064 [Auricularia subglabra TFB-10046 SS5]|nr:hypothetical protein AURDEDRAFT_167064 [Auricularia subglabra TFB-10046 SS5]